MNIFILRRLQHHGIRVKRYKYSFLQEPVEYLGHRVDGEGLHTTSKKMGAIQLASTPRREVHPKPVHDPQPPPLNELLRKDIKWRWSAAA